MEAMDIFLATSRDVSYVILNHPMYSALGSVIVILSLLRFYCRLTLGGCDSDADMTGKTVLITGASDGIGKATAFELARRNARVILACRNLEKANKVAQQIKTQTGNKSIVVKALDLCSFASVRKCAQDVLKTEDLLHVLINNAGMFGSAKREFTEDGSEKAMQANHLGHFLLTLMLLDLLKRSAPSRIINVSSAAYVMSKLDINDFNGDKMSSSPMSLYSNTKLANILFTKELASRLAGTGVTVNALHPGMVKTNILFGSDGIFVMITKLLLTLLGKSADEGAQTSIFLSISPGVEKTTGKYYSDCKEEKLQNRALDKAMAKKLFEVSEQIVGVSFEQASKARNSS